VSDDPAAVPRPDWRDASSYEYTRALTEEGWAWEFLRRNPDYARAWRESGEEAAARGSGKVRVLAQMAPPKEAAAWGLLTFRRPPVQRARRRRALAS